MKVISVLESDERGVEGAGQDRTPVTQFCPAGGTASCPTEHSFYANAAQRVQDMMDGYRARCSYWQVECC